MWKRREPGVLTSEPISCTVSNSHGKVTSKPAAFTVKGNCRMIAAIIVNVVEPTWRLHAIPSCNTDTHTHTHTHTPSQRRCLSVACA